MDEMVICAEELLIRTVVTRLKGHPGVGIWNLANEPDLVYLLTTSPSASSLWVTRLSNLIRSIDPVTPITCGLHAPSLREDVGFHVDEVFDSLDCAVMHGYPMYAKGI